MADKSVITTLESRVRELMDDHKRLSEAVRSMTAELAKLKGEKRSLEEENKRLRSELQRKELAEGFSGDSRNRDKARARVNRLMREVDKCIALLGGIEDAAAREEMKQAK
ncbi:MAG: hypothetical protein E7145_04515 [Rikenellaceae bacterium]|nr:hypothetical protein [Rikenellaceae bacterium]MBR3772914.1 hypothetical protein [Alistipes sp.]